MVGDYDPQADAVVDRLLAELKEAEAKGAAIRAKHQPPAEPTGESEPPKLRSALYKKIQEKGESLSTQDIMKLVSREVRKGV